MQVYYVTIGHGPYLFKLIRIFHKAPCGVDDSFFISLFKAYLLNNFILFQNY
jgi:hypothetical protein